MTKDGIGAVSTANALKMAIVALESSGGKFFDKEINACKEALEQPAKKPLSDDEINELWKESCEDVRGLNLGFTTQQHYFAWLIEQAHGIGVKE